MSFALGRTYRNEKLEIDLHICSLADTVMFGRTFIAEKYTRKDNLIDLVSIGNSIIESIGFVEVDPRIFASYPEKEEPKEEKKPTKKPSKKTKG